MRLDLGFANVPVDAIEIESSTPRYVRSVTVEGSNDGTTFVGLGGARSLASGESTLAARGRGRDRYLRVTIRNGDDAPWPGFASGDARAASAPRRRGLRPPFRLSTGVVVAAPHTTSRGSRDGHRIRACVGGHARPGGLNEDFEPPADTRTFFEKHDGLVNGLLVLAALVVAVGGLLALRRRA